MNRVYTAGTELRARINRHKNKKNIYTEFRKDAMQEAVTLCFQTENVFCGFTASRLFPSVPLFH